MSIASAEITNMVTYTAQERAKTDTLTGAANELTSEDFLKLMLEQLQYQDPLDPVSNSEFIAQQAQFSQLEATQEISSTLAGSTTVAQAFSLIGKQVAITNPDNTSTFLTGTVDAVYVDGEDTCLTVGGKNYPMKYLMYAYEVPETAADTTKPANSSGS